jgi:hypothetical protein
MRILLALTIALVSCSVAFAEDFHIEFTASYWPLHPSGNVLTRSTLVDLRSDLGIQDRKNQAMFKVVVKPGMKHRINFEVAPYRLKGQNDISRTFQFGGRTYSVRDRISSEANINYIFGAYQYDFVSNDQGHVGVVTGVAYFDAMASATSQTAGSTGNEQRKIPLPIVGGEFRVFPVPGKDILNINGEAKGMSFGSYGRYFQANVNAGVAVARFVRLQAGFNLVDADVHQKDRTQGFKLRFAGPIFSVQLHD